jgi:predicted O-methyltransferase YrrM
MSGIACRVLRYSKLRLGGALNRSSPFRAADRWLLWWILFHPTGFRVEGHMTPWQANIVCQWVASSRALRVAQVGFNSGHSAAAMLSSSSQVHVTSFDLGDHRYTVSAARWINRRFPGRHELVVGNSVQTVPGYTLTASSRFDLVIIDGGHLYEQALADLCNCASLALSGAIVIMDDIGSNGWGDGPKRAWKQAIADGLVEEIRIYEDPAGGKFAVGRYL